jgi:hypothetical protein
MNDKENNKLEAEKQGSVWSNLGNEWKLYIAIFLKPLIIIPAMLSFFSLYYDYATDIADKRFSFALNAFAAVALAIAGGSLYDALKSLTGDTILIKKGLSAVRNLSLARHKTKNIAGRTKQGATLEEIKNLLTLLEKDIANATQEWNDILPGVEYKEEIYTILAEKENELEIAQNEKEQLKTQMEKDKELGESEKEKLRKNIEKKDKEALRLSQEISKLQLTASTPISGISRSISLADVFKTYIPDTSNSGEARLVKTLRDYEGIEAAKATLSNVKICSRCGKSYFEHDTSKLWVEGICQDCSSKG